MTISKKHTSNATHSEPVFVVGATSSLAQAICRALAEKGYPLILGGRDQGELSILASDIAIRYQGQASIVLFDFMDPQFSAELLVNGAAPFHHIIIATGDMGTGQADDIHDIAITAHNNYILPAQIASAGALRMANEGIKGNIAIISSVAGDRGRQSNFAYGSAKAALSAFASGLRNYYFAKGIHVMTVKPGFIDTPMTWGMQSPLIASREFVAGKIVCAMEAKKDVVYVPFFWRYIMLIITSIPERLFKKLKL